MLFELRRAAPGTAVSISALSVSSKVSFSGGMPHGSVSSSTVSKSPCPSARQRAPRLIAIVRS